ncbi:MAG TPA: hypothetical protein VGR45_02135 [Stellaceae bacterium]|nr:hypothetical protein [Stellaceae bacterium]
MDGIIRPEDLYGVEIREADGIYLRQITIPQAGSLIPQHAHKYDHLTMLVKGEIYVAYADQCEWHKAPAAIHIRKDTKHTFLSVTNDVEIWCVHNLRNSQDPEIVEEYNLVAVA